MENVVLNSDSAAPDSTASTFQPGNHLLGIVQRVVASGASTRIILPGKGEMVILPDSGLYYSNARDFVDFCRTPSSQFEVAAFGNSALPYEQGSGKNIKSLLWQAAFHASEGRLIDGCTKYDVVQFKHWPNLTRLPITPNAARICALLTRTPSTIMLVHRVLGIDKDEVYQIYSAAHSIGICHKIGSNPEKAKSEAELHEKQAQPAKEHGLFRSLLAKISGL